MKIGDYVRTKKGGYIGKIYNINEFREPSMRYALDIPKAYDDVFMGEEDFKSSPNIIDLIKVGDYVNGKKVIKVSQDYIFDYTEEFTVISFSENDYIYSNQDIKSIVTKEQFKSMEYKLGDK